MGGSPGLIRDLSGKIQVSGGEDAGIHIIIDGLFREHDLVWIIGTDMVDGLSLADQGGDEGVELKSFGFRNADAGTGLGEKSFILLLGKARRVEMFFESTAFSFRAAIADIGRPG